MSPTSSNRFSSQDCQFFNSLGSCYSIAFFPNSIFYFLFFIFLNRKINKHHRRLKELQVKCLYPLFLCQRRPVRCPGPALWLQDWSAMGGLGFRPSSPTQPGTTARCSASPRTMSSPCWSLRPATAGTTERTRRQRCESGFALFRTNLSSRPFLGDVSGIAIDQVNMWTLPGAAGFPSPTPG